MLRRPLFWLLLLIVWWVALFILSHQSQLFPPGPDIKHIDKVEHAAYFTLGGFLFFVVLRLVKPRMSFLAAALLTVLACSVIGALDEFHQSFIPNRSGNDVGDWLADTLGGVLGSILGQWFSSRLLAGSRQRPA
jgi:VanZ family protein